MAGIVGRLPWLRHVFADGGYAGKKLRAAPLTRGKGSLAIVERSDAAKGCDRLQRRRVAEAIFAWLGRCRHVVKASETAIASSTAWANIAAI